MVTAQFRRTKPRDSSSSLLALACLGVLGCGSEPDAVRLDVLLLTDYRPGIDFVEVRAEVLEETASTRVVSDDESFISPSDVARLQGLTPAQMRRLRVELVRRDGTLLQRSRTVSFAHQRDRQQLTRICAACEEFACPFGQTCECGLEPTCVPDECAEDECTTTSCEADTDCRESGLSCVDEVCREGVCLRAPDDAVCATATVCDVVGGECIPDPRPSGQDAGGADADVMSDVDGGVDAGPEPSAPRPLAPLSTSTVTSQRPTLRWELAVGTEGARLELCRDRAMITGCLAAEEVLADRVRPAAPLAAGWWYWRLRGVSAGRESATTSPVWQFRVGTRSADGDRDTSWGTVADVNGDGFADVIVGAPGADPGGRTDAGTASVYLGSPAGLASTSALVLEGVAANDQFGESVASAGDVNGDGFADVVVGAYTASPGGRTDAGTASVYLGSPAGLSSTPALVLEGVAAGDFFGVSVASAGDVDGDGFADVVVGATFADPGGRTDAGTASVYLGSPTGLSSTPALGLEGVAANDHFGRSVASAGDVDGDGFADVVVGAPRADPGDRIDAGTARVYLGSSAGLSSTPALVLEGVAAGDFFGESVASAGDVDGDGFADLVVCARLADPGGRTDAGTASVYLGSPAGLSSTAALVLEGVAANDNFGMPAASARDVDGDGFADVIVGARLADPGGRTDAGTASVYLGSPAGLSSTPALVLEGVAAGDFFGGSFANAGDVDGDGFADVVVGARFADPGGRSDAGTASVYLGSPAGLSSTTALVLEGVAAGDFFGESVASGG
jgi:hypothetical protein